MYNIKQAHPPEFELVVVVVVEEKKWERKADIMNRLNACVFTCAKSDRKNIYNGNVNCALNFND